MAVGPQTPEQAAGMGLPFAVLSDPKLEVTKEYGLLHPEGKMFQDVPRPTTILIESDRTIRWLRAADHIRNRPTLEEIVEQLRK